MSTDPDSSRKGAPSGARRPPFARVAGMWIALAAASGCSGSGASIPHSAPASQQQSNPASIGSSPSIPPGAIQHVVIIIQENRSFDNLFQGYPGADTSPTGKDSHGNTITLQSTPFEAGYDIIHDFSNFVRAYDNGKMDGFDTESITGGHTGYPNPQYGYVPAVETRLYVAMAQQYVLGDRMFTSNLDGSFVSHQYAIAAQAQSAVDYPTTWWGCDGGPSDTITTLTQQRLVGPTEAACFDYTTLADEMDKKKLTWRSYTPGFANTKGGIWNSFQAVNHIRHGPEWATNVISPETKILQDIPAGTLANLTWVVPSFANSDHAGVDTPTGGPNWVASIVNAIGTSQFWNSTVIFVFWDDWGGWYDHVPPPQLDYDGLGIRVPLLCISPYAGKGVVSHVQYETGSLLHFVEGTFGLPYLAASDKRSTSAGVGCLRTSKPRPFVPFATTTSPQDFLHQRASNRGPDDG
jgi:phospholipase C